MCCKIEKKTYTCLDLINEDDNIVEKDIKNSLYPCQLCNL